MMIVRSVFGQAIQYPTAHICLSSGEVWMLQDKDHKIVAYVPKDRFIIEPCENEKCESLGLNNV